mgnify:FL=1
MLEYVQDGCFSFQFYIKPQLAITILALACRCFSFQFYIKPQQTAFSVRFQHGCFSFQFYIKPQHHRRCRCSAEDKRQFQFYIKPQHLARGSSIRIVVSHSNSTSNHNIRKEISASIKLFLIPILHQTTTQSAFMKRSARCFSFQFYIKPQPSTASSSQRPSCFSFQFYIKPQLRCLQAVALLVVSHSNSTSNHNLAHGSNSYSARYTYDTDA